MGKTERYDSEYMPYMDLQDIDNLYENIRNAPTNTYRTPPRHNPSRCCDVPALQSPKNAVAPTQTLIATSTTGADYANSIQRMKNVLADQQVGVATKKELENNKLNQISQDDKPSLLSVCPTSIISTSLQNGQALNAEASSSRYISQVPILNGLENTECTSPAQTVYMNGLTISNTTCECNVSTASHSVNSVPTQSAHSFTHNNKNNQNSATGLNTTTSSVQLGQASTLFAKNGAHGTVSPACSYQFPENIDQCFGSLYSQYLTKPKDPKCHTCCGKTNPGYVNTAATLTVNPEDDLMKFSDDENRENIAEKMTESRGVHRTSTVFSIGLMFTDESIVRSCSVGYLDLVDHQLVPCDLDLRLPNKRLVLVSRKTKRRKRNKPHQQNANQSNTKPPRLRNCGKSKSLDSSDIFPSNEQIALSQLPKHVEETIGVTSSEVAEVAEVAGATKQSESAESPKDVKRALTEKREECNAHAAACEANAKEKPSQAEAVPSPAM